ncbi:pyridine nucleotide-disulfide oxidoreductase [Sphaerisporangium melleum]|uniref:Pyridine nucleotide-disulfide oxidoreductase n=1 Tax=Sphaerisporangium melleum TaxID=321316 RepID=A0A917VHU7_9ACTN|nr:FAD-dependent oxidoreductase [Sphaerisporangium melleum]GGK79371.1 pyridine nucleotide-disulfide oxidoreductase [Sphaerisporangium melleum]GII69710.1 pyridine nucleotide-disulfide oxidoreductase [Sphaerisporangium melleum]
MEDVDLLVVGGGKGGKTLAMDAARSGRRVAMVERGMIGGTCINVACIPTKSLVTSARLLQRIRRAGEVGVRVEKAEADLPLLRAHKEGVVGGMVDINHRQFIDSGMDFILGTARFVAERTVEVDLVDGGRRVLRGADVVVNTGTVPHVPAIPGLAEVSPLTSESILRLERIPDHLVVIGGGYVGLEFAQMFASFGSGVTVLDRNPRLLPGEDPDVAEALTGFLREDGVVIHTGVQVERVSGETGAVTVRLTDGREVAGSDVLVATGRAPVTRDLDLAAAGVEVDDRGFVKVDDRLATSAPHTWAVGDVAGSPQFTHVSLDDYRILKANLAGGDRRTTGRLVPWNLFTDPELARVGLTETEARAAGMDVRVAKLPVAAIPRARTTREMRGLWKAIVDRESERVLGVALLGPESSEVLTVVQTAMLAGLPYPALRDAIIAHPTMAEGLNLLFASFAD